MQQSLLFENSIFSTHFDGTALIFILALLLHNYTIYRAHRQNLGVYLSICLKIYIYVKICINCVNVILLYVLISH